MSQDGSPKPCDIPHCVCGAERIFEFQVLQLNHFCEILTYKIVNRQLWLFHQWINIGSTNFSNIKCSSVIKVLQS